MQRIIRYTVKPERLDENLDLVRGVYAELHATSPDGLRYATFRHDDVGFVHVVSVETEDGSNPLEDVAAFGRFQAGIGDRVTAPPTVTDLEEIGAYGVFGS
jgi:hypothetical protein